MKADIPAPQRARPEGVDVALSGRAFAFMTHDTPTINLMVRFLYHLNML